jgi:hypothetical protein
MRTGKALVLAVAAIALPVAAAAPAASAMAPQWQHCGKAVPKNSGLYADKLCTVAAEPGHGKYEVNAGAGKKPLKGKASNAHTRLLVTVPGGAEQRVECEKASLKAHPTGMSGVTQAHIGLSKCRSQGLVCDSVETESLSGSLGWLSPGHAGLSLTNEKTPGTGLIADIHCEEGAEFRVTGAFIVGIAPSGGPLTKEHTLAGELGEYLGEPSPGYRPLTNPPAFEEGPVGTLLIEYAEPNTGGELTPEGGRPSGFEGEFAVTGEAVSIS